MFDVSLVICWLLWFVSDIEGAKLDEARVHYFVYKCVKSRVCEHFSKYQLLFVLKSFTDNVYILSESASDGIVFARKCLSSNIVCLGSNPSINKYFFFYSYLITNMHVWFPLDDFFMGVLRTLNVVLTQLHAWSETVSCITEVVADPGRLGNFVNFEQASPKNPYSTSLAYLFVFNLASRSRGYVFYQFVYSCTLTFIWLFFFMQLSCPLGIPSKARTSSKMTFHPTTSPFNDLPLVNPSAKNLVEKDEDKDLVTHRQFDKSSFGKFC